MVQDCRESRFCFDDGKEDSVKETQEGCLSRSIHDFLERSLFKKVALSGAKRLFRHAGTMYVLYIHGTLSYGKMRLMMRSKMVQAP